MNPPPKVTEAEWQVMLAFWDGNAVSAQDVSVYLQSKVDWHLKTIKTLLSRLVKKQVLRFEKKGNKYLYYPEFSKSECVLAESQSFLNKLFEGSVNPLISCLIANNALKESEIAELKKMLDEE